ncbi:MAG: hypothetical protein IT370_23720 [Deltaproteobacteria bacterium]|nr:hypothetical protein [Deltaproteobacteria bacterium]
MAHNGRGRGGDGPRDRDRDRGRDGGRSTGSGSGGSGGGGGAGQSRSQKSYRAQLDRLFESGKIGELVASTEKARAFASTSGAPAGTPPQVTVSTGKVLRNQPSGGTAADDRQRESRAGLGAELARAIARAESGASALPSTPAAAAPVSADEATPTPSISARRAALPLPAAAGDAVTAGDAETRLKLIAKLRDAEGRDAITRATEALAARFPIPDDFELLTRLLEHRDDARVTYALERLGGMLRKEQPRRGRALAAQLRFLEETSDEAEVRSKAAEVRALVK